MSKDKKTLTPVGGSKNRRSKLVPIWDPGAVKASTLAARPRLLALVSHF